MKGFPMKTQHALWYGAAVVAVALAAIVLGAPASLVLLALLLLACPVMMMFMMGGMGGGMGRMGGAGGMGGMPMQSPMGGMGQSGGQSQNMGGGMDNMMQMMRMMHGQMTSPPKAGTAPDAGVAASGPADVTERLEGRIAFLKAELQITDKQAADWSLLADALRSGRQHLLDARKLLVVDDKISGSERIEHYERHLAERLEAIKAARTAFNRLYGNLSDDQKKTADSILLPLIATF
jgi:hypothetical protein